jgi:hypothetical protein
MLGETVVNCLRDKKDIFLKTKRRQSHFITHGEKHLITFIISSYFNNQQPSQQQNSTIMKTARDLLLRGIRFFASLCGRKPEKKNLTYEWEERLAYVEAEHDAEDGEANRDEHDMQFERSCGVSRYRD